MTILADLAEEQDRLEKILSGLGEAQWLADSAAAGWTVADVVLHLAQGEEAVLVTISGGSMPAYAYLPGDTVDDRMAEAVRLQRAAPPEVFQRWQQARRGALTALGTADPGRPVQWVTGPVKPATLATTRLAEHWAHGLDITGPLGIDFPDTGRLRHVAWLAHRTLPYAMTTAGEQPAEVRCELTAPEGTWEFGRPDAESVITGPAGDFCRVAARRLDPARSALKASGPHGATALRLIRTYA
jgi:uncharacterized protein (TIGR03084 family)